MSTLLDLLRKGPAKLEDFFPKVNYGQEKNKAWSPAARSEVYQQAERARTDAGFANQFAADIIMSKEKTGSRVYDVTGKAHDTKGYLYNKHSLNAAESWAGQAFAAPVIKGQDGNFYTAYSQLNMSTGTQKKMVGTSRENHHVIDATVYKSGGASGFGFVQGEKITDAAMLRQLKEGVYAFTAKGANGQTVYVPYASGYELQKGYGGRPEAGNYKEGDAGGAPERDKRNAWNVQPGVVSDPLGMKQTLLGGAAKQEVKNRTLLG